MQEAGFFDRLRQAAGPVWDDYVDHAFIAGIADGSLPEPAFRHYLGQDYLFLLQFARAYALAVYKSDSLEDMRAEAAGMSAILDVETHLHVTFCAGWGLDEAAMAALPEDPACIAYTRFVLERGMAGDILDLHVALSPCIIGYAHIGRRLAADPATKMAGNPYADWIAMYAGDDYQEVAAAAEARLNKIAKQRGGEARFASLSRDFSAATLLEVGFWQMVLERA